MVVVPVSSVTETCNGAVTEFRFKRCWVSVSKRAFFYILPFFGFLSKTIKTQSFSLVMTWWKRNNSHFSL